jgi:hypothetical protein
MKENTKKLRIPLLSVVIVAVAAIVFCFAFFTPPPVNAGSLIEYDVNEDGLTYGSASEALIPEQEPDLIRAYATNGAEGYVYKTDLEHAQSPYPPKNPEEAVLLMENRFMAASLTFVDYVNSQTDLKLSVANKDANVALKSIFEAYGGEVPFDSLTETEKSTIINLFPNGIKIDVAVNAYNAACAANDRSIPVYKADGKTVIGEFVVT